MDDLSTLTPFELKERIDRLRKSADEFERDAKKYQEELDKRDQEECKAFIGKCYQMPDKCFKIIGAPQFVHTIARTYYERNQFPAIIVERDTESFDDIYEDNIFRGFINSSFSGAGAAMIDPQYAKEISEEEFNKILFEKIAEATKHQAAKEKFAGLNNK